MLGGWSMGGVVAFEMARQLSAEGQQVELLALIDSRIPGRNKDGRRSDETSRLLSFGRLLGLTQEHLTLSLDEIRQLTRAERWDYLEERVKTANIFPADFASAELKDLYKIYEQNVQALRNYVPQKYSGRLVLFNASEQPATQNGQEPTIDWSDLAEGGVTVQIVPGNHYTMIRQPGVKDLAERLRACIDQVAEV